MAGVTFVLEVYNKAAYKLSSSSHRSTSTETIGEIIGVSNESSGVTTQAIAEPSRTLGYYGWKISALTDDSVRVSTVAKNSSTVAEVVEMMHENPSYTSAEAMGIKLVERVNTSDSYEDSYSTNPDCYVIFINRDNSRTITPVSGNGYDEETAMFDSSIVVTKTIAEVLGISDSPSQTSDTGYYGWDIADALHQTVTVEQTVKNNNTIGEACSLLAGNQLYTGLTTLGLRLKERSSGIESGGSSAEGGAKWQ